MNTIVPARQIPIDKDRFESIFLPDDLDLEQVQLFLEINCGFNMYNKKLALILKTDKEEFRLPDIMLTQMYKLQVPLDIPKHLKKAGRKTLLIKPLQLNNYPVYIGVIKAVTNHSVI